MYYKGRMAMLNDDLPAANRDLTFALANCHKDALGNRRYAVSACTQPIVNSYLWQRNPRPPNTHTPLLRLED